MRIAVMGAGAIGGTIGVRLANAGADVAFIARGSHLNALRLKGLRLESPFGDVHLNDVTATDAPADLGPVDLVLFAVKLYDAEAAAGALAPLIGPRTRVVTFQNGIDSMKIVSKAIGREPVIGGVTYISAFVSEPGVIVSPGGMTRVIVGRASDPMIVELAALAVGLPGVSFEAVEDIEPVVWDKFVTLSALSGATSLLRAPIGPILADQEARTFLLALRDEGLAISRAAGHSWPDDHAERILARWEGLPPGTRASMANDLASGRRLELQWLSGRMHQLGRELDIPTPAHSAVYRALHLHAEGHGGQGTV
jgi:2-dehydropantoate 2-reductase